MKKSYVIGVAALLAAGTAGPAFAEWNHVGDLELSPDHYSSVQLGGFAGPVEQIGLHATGRSDCDNVRVTFANGTTRDVFAGTISNDEDQLITFPDRNMPVKAVSLHCRAENDIGARIAVAADMPDIEPGHDAPGYRPYAHP